MGESPENVVCQRLSDKAELPVRMTEGSSGFDLHACLSSPVTLSPGDWQAVPTGLRMAIPSGMEGQVRPRSGLALKHGVGLLNSPGTIDSDYRGEVKVILKNWGREPMRIEHGDRIAQIVFARVEPVAVRFGEVEPSTARGDGGFGHTGTRTQTVGPAPTRGGKP